MISTADFRNGVTIELDGKLYEIVYFQHVKPGKGGAFVRTKLKELKSGCVLDKTFRAGEKLTRAVLDEREMQYLYRQDNLFYFMNMENYEQVVISEKQLGENVKFLKENIIVAVLMHNENLLGVKLPLFVELKVTMTEPGVRGDTASGGSKPVTLETGAVIQAPLFINNGDLVRVDTRTGKYVERA
ncbi:MAG: elongation factor P [Nitrospirae bacterium]|nr:elongation factor P [Nitrospirota bacterium]